MSTDPMYGPDIQEPDPEEHGLGLSDAVIREQLDQLAKKGHSDKAEQRSQKRAPKDRMLRMPRRDR